jgi:hypothetical protein
MWLQVLSGRVCYLADMAQVAQEEVVSVACEAPELLALSSNLIHKRADEAVRVRIHSQGKLLSDRLILHVFTLADAVVAVCCGCSSCCWPVTNCMLRPC